uniref:Uncharacterized protein n=1 Tax=Arundo donax TaxID=35708 RepID=A0A0A9HN44_ARUDO
MATPRCLLQFYLLDLLLNCNFLCLYCACFIFIFSCYTMFLCCLGCPFAGYCKMYDLFSVTS